MRASTPERRRAEVVATIAIYLSRAVRDDWDDLVVAGAAVELLEEIDKLLAPDMSRGDPEPRG